MIVIFRLHQQKSVSYITRMSASAVNNFIDRYIFDLFFVFYYQFGYIIVLSKRFPLIEPATIKYIKFIIKQIPLCVILYPEELCNFHCLIDLGVNGTICNFTKILFRFEEMSKVRISLRLMNLLLILHIKNQILN